MPRRLADSLKKGIYPDNLAEAIREAKDYARRRPDVGWPFHAILDQIAKRWEPYESSGIPADEFERVKDTVCPRMIAILKRLAEVPGYDPRTDVEELERAYATIA